MQWRLISAGFWGALWLGAALLVAPSARSAGLKSQFAGGGSHALFISPSGILWAWGANQYGQLGQVSGDHRVTPVPVLISGVVQVAAGRHHSLAMLSNGSMLSWGLNTSGQLGNNSPSYSSSPVQVGIAAEPLKKIAAGGDHSLRLTATGFLSGWGSNSHGQIASKSGTYYLYPTNIQAPAPLSDIAAGGLHNAAVARDTGVVYTWGDNAHGQLGDGTTTQRRALTPVPGLSGFIRVAAGENHTLALKGDGTVWGWGGNGSGQLGDGTLNARHSPVQVQGLADVVDIAAGGHHSLAVKSDGSVWTWGTNEYGELGNGSAGTLSDLPVQVSGFTGRAGLACGYNFNLAMLSDGQPYAWGRNNVGQIGDGTMANRASPLPVGIHSGLLATSIAAGNGFSLAILQDGFVRAWGNNNTGQLGNDTSYVQKQPQFLPGPANAVQVAGGEAFSLILTADGTVWGCGGNSLGELTLPTVSSFTAQRLTSIKDVAALAAGKLHVLALKTDGTVWSWGGNYLGVLGYDTGSTTNRTPGQVPGLEGIIQVAAGSDFSLALKSDGTVWAWGANPNGQLGNGTTGSGPTPVQVRGLTGVTSIAAGGYHGLALRSDGAVWAWGSNSHSQLGDGTTYSGLVPKQVLGIPIISAVSAGQTSSFAVDNTGNLWTWGGNAKGQLGDGTTANQSRPVKMPFFGVIKKVAGGTSHALAIVNDGTVWAWGDNYYGSIGDGTTTRRLQPTETWGSN